MSDLEQEARRVIDRIWELHVQLPEVAIEDGPGARQLLAAAGWWTRIVRTARAVKLLHDQGLAHESAPLKRALFHHVIALKWLVLYPAEALDAIVWEHGLEGNKMLKKAIERAWDISADAGPACPTSHKPSGMQYLQNTEALCAKVEMPDVYPAFLLESKYVHPTLISADAYLTREADTGSVVIGPPDGMPLHGLTVLVADATVSFATLAGLTNIEREAAELRDGLFNGH